MSNTIRVAIGQFNELSHERLTFAQQIGASGVLLNTPTLPGEQRWETSDLQWLRRRCDQYGLRLEALENVPNSFFERAMLGLDGRDEQIANYQATIRNMGEAGIPILGYHWMPNGVWRTPSVQARGGALATAFDIGKIDSAPLVAGVRKHPLLGDRELSAEQMWDNYQYFMERVLPVAEASGVTLALHPDDPPVPVLGGIARLFGSFAGFKRAVETFDSPQHGLDFCMGCWSEMGPGAIDAIRYFGARGKIVYVHFRDVQGHVPVFQECFLGEGNVDVVAAMRALKEVDFGGFIIDDHVPQLIDDTGWGHRGRAHATGYIMGLVDAVGKLG
ncbi:MAG: mannonate dehydratase [Roseiflexaceae bacterium]